MTVHPRLTLVETAGVIAALADFKLLDADDGGLVGAMETPCRSLLLHTDAGPGIGPVALGVLITTASGAPLVAGHSLRGARLDFWVDLAELYVREGQPFELGYPNRVVGRGVVSSVFRFEP